MKSLTRHLWFTTKRHREYLNITPQVEAFVAEFDGQRRKRVLLKVIGD